MAGKVYIPTTEEGITWSTERKGSPGQLNFNVVKDDVINFTEGNAVRMKVDDKNIFYGFVFTKKEIKKASSVSLHMTNYDISRIKTHMSTRTKQQVNSSKCLQQTLLCKQERLKTQGSK